VSLKNAFKVNSFHKGLPGTELNIPLIENENEAKLKHLTILKSSLMITTTKHL
jgi:hypothetical protein